MPALPSSTLQRLVRAQRRVSVTLSALMMAIYFGFILLSAYGKTFMGTEITGGLSVGILMGASVIVFAFVLTGVYVRWANIQDRRLHGSSNGARSASS